MYCDINLSTTSPVIQTQVMSFSTHQISFNGCKSVSYQNIVHGLNGRYSEFDLSSAIIESLVATKRQESHLRLSPPAASL